MPRVVLIQTAYIGDCVLSLATAHMAARLSKQPCTVVTRPQTVELFQTSPHVDRCIPFDKRGLHATPSGLLRVATTLRSHLPPSSIALLPQGSLRSAWLALAARIPQRIGFQNAPARPFLTRSVHRSPLRPFDEMQLLRAAFPATPLPNPTPSPSLTPPAHATAFALQHIPTHQPAVALCISSARPTKRPSLHLLRTLALCLLQHDLTPVLLGSPAEAPIARYIQHSTNVQCIDATSTTLLEAAAVLERCIHAIGPDSGLLHLARSVKTPTSVLYGPTPKTPFLTAAHHTAITRPLPCRPCSPNGPHTCPLKHRACMHFTKPEVEKIVHAILQEQKRP